MKQRMAELEEQVAEWTPIVDNVESMKREHNAHTWKLKDQITALRDELAQVIHALPFGL